MQAGRLIRRLRQDALVAPLLPPAPEEAGGRWLSCARLQRAQTLSDLIGDFGASAGHADGDRRALASLWSRWHFGAVLPPLLAAVLLHGMWPTAAAVRLSARHTSCDVRWRQRMRALDAGRGGDLGPCLLRQAEPLVQALSQVSGASPRVFWSNLGNLLEYLLSALRDHPRAAPARVAAFDALLAGARLDDGRHNPLHQPVRYLPAAGGGTQRVRRLCCLYDLLPGAELCGNCPRLHAPPRSRHVPA